MTDSINLDVHPPGCFGQEDPSIDTHLTAAGLTSGAYSGLQHQKDGLFMSSAEVYTKAAQDMPEKLEPIGASDALKSIEAVLTKSHLKARRPGQRFGRLPSPRRPSPSPPIPATNLDSSTASPQAPKVEEDEYKALNKLLQKVRSYDDQLLEEFGEMEPHRQRALLGDISCYLRQGMAAVQSFESKEKERRRKRKDSRRWDVIHCDLRDKRLEAKKLMVNLEIKVTELFAPLLSEDLYPLEVNTDDIYSLPIDLYNGISQVIIVLAVVCNMVMGMSIIHVNFVLRVAILLVRMVMSHSALRQDGLSDAQDEVLKNLPNTLHEALRDFNVEGKLELYATCPVCSATHPPLAFKDTEFPTYPERCSGEIVGEMGTTVCGADLLVSRPNGTLQPVKPYLVSSFADYLARCLADPIYVEQSKRATDVALESIRDAKVPSTVHNVFEAEFMREFRGPDKKLFVKRGDKIRLAFALHMDFFNPNGNTRRGNHNSIGIISAANLALDPSIRYLPEFMYIAGVIPGPHEPSVDEVDHFLRPITQQFRRAWRPGIRLSRTADSNAAVTVESAVVLSINDLPAARKVAGLQGHNSAIFICSRCNLSGKDQIFNTDRSLWKPRDCKQLRSWANKWKEAKTLQERKHIFENYGVRWTSMWDLDYWDPTRMLVVDSMHCLLEGLVHYHCRHVLRFDASAKKLTPDGFKHAFDWPWVPYSPEDAPVDCRVAQPHIPKIGKIHEGLSLALEGDRSMTLNEVWTRLENVGTRPTLRYVAWSLGLYPGTVEGQTPISSLYVHRMQRKSKSKDREKITFPQGRPVYDKNHCIAVLLNWRLKRDLSCQPRVIPTTSPEILGYIQNVIRETIKPSWVNSVPKNYGEASAGSIKADEWRTLSGVYLPIALITLWGDLDGSPPPEDDSDQGLLTAALDHTMALFQATIIACKDTMSTQRTLAYRRHIAHWIENLRKLYPHTYESIPRPNTHAACHIFDFLVLFGPVHSWWCFPFERVIGALQKINTNDQIGGLLEGTIMRSQTRVGNIRRWLRRPDCPEAIKEVKSLFDKSFIPANSIPIPEECEFQGSHPAYVRRGDVYFSPSATHEGNAIVFYRSHSSTEPVPGRIERIECIGGLLHFHVRQYLPIQPSIYDPFGRYPDFPAKTFSSESKSTVDCVTLECIIGHAARFDFSHQRSVFCDLSRT